MKLLKLLSGISISTGLGLVFLFSGYSKLTPLIEPFEFTFVELGLGNWYTAPVIARLLIGVELFIGFLLVANYRLKKFTLPLALSLLVFFIIYLVIQIATAGNEGNCGCFGEYIKMTPLEAIYKNLLMIGGAVALYLIHQGWSFRTHHTLILSLVCIFSLGLPFILNPVDYTYTSNNQDEKVGYILELDLLYDPSDTSEVEIPAVDLRQGKQVVAFLSLSCSHCRIAAKKFRLLKKNNPDLPIYFVLNGKKEDHADFIKDTKADNIPSSFCLGKTFVRLSSSRLPRIYYLDNSVVIKKVDYFELNQYEIEEWLNTGNIK